MHNIKQQNRQHCGGIVICELSNLPVLAILFPPGRANALKFDMEPLHGADTLPCDYRGDCNALLHQCLNERILTQSQLSESVRALSQHWHTNKFLTTLFAIIEIGRDEIFICKIHSFPTAQYDHRVL